MSDLGPRSFRRGAFLLLLAATLLAAWPSLQGDVLSYDDAGLLYGSSGGRGALQRGPASFFGTELFYYAYLPFYGLSYWVDGLFGADHEHTFLFHLQNVLWHAATSFLVFCLLAILLRHRLAALLGALLFAVHPLHVESVAWIAGRKELLSGFFLFLAWLLALEAEKRRGGVLAAALAAFLVACFSKASAVGAGDLALLRAGGRADGGAPCHRRLGGGRLRVAPVRRAGGGVGVGLGRFGLPDAPAPEPVDRLSRGARAGTSGPCSSIWIPGCAGGRST